MISNTHDAPLLRLAGVGKIYGRTAALSDVDIEIRKNEVLGLLGDNGAGKSTLIKILSGVLPRSSGTFEAGGHPADIRSRHDSAALGIETIYQDIALVGPMPIWRNMFLARELCSRLGFLRCAEMRRTTIEILHRGVEISGVDDPDAEVASLSGGQMQAVAIARAVHFRSKMLLLDEPTSALSVRETENVLKYMVDLRDEGVSSVFVTHNLYHAFQVCDRFVVMSHGRKVADVAKKDTSIEALTRLIVAH
jgi:simple sugar transport system ATP-binding protein